jgi:transposase
LAGRFICPDLTIGRVAMMDRNFQVFVGIDISKDFFTVCAITDPQKVVFQSTFPMNKQGFEDFTQKLSPFPKEDVLIAKESSGCYHINLFAYLSQQDFNCLVLNPLLVNKFWGYSKI